MLAKQWLMTGAISGFFSVVFGAFAAHLLKDKLSERAFLVFQTGVHYQMFHALALVGLGLLGLLAPSLDTRITGWAFLLGIILFSGSLYTLALTDIKILGAIAPLGGTAFLVGWITFAFLAGKA